MLLQKNRYNRRQFLERSAWGFGSAFVLPSLLASCTDHQITPTDPSIPIIIPPYSAVEINWNDAAKVAVKTGLEAVPEVGEILGPLVEIFWPKPEEDVWSQVRTQVEDLINQKIEDSKYQDVSDTLGKASDAGPGTGLIGTISLYQNELYAYSSSVVDYYYDKTKPEPNPTALIAQFVSTRSLFVASEQHFRAPGYELQLLPLFAQFANLYLAFLRQVVLFGQDWGRSSIEHQQDVKYLHDAINSYTDYANATFNKGLADLPLQKRNDVTVEPFRTLNKFNRGMALTVLDYRDTWKYYDPTAYPKGAVNSDGTPINMMTQEIYSDPYGSIDFSTNPYPLVLPLAATQFPTQLTVWVKPRISAIQLTYPANGGPNDVTQTPRMGDLINGNTTPDGGVFNLSPNNPITNVRVITGVYVGYYFQDYLPSGLQFQFNDGTTTALYGDTGGNIGPLVGSGLFGYTNRALSSILIHGSNKELGGADCVVFGFLPWQSPITTLMAIREIYVKSPNELSVADLTKAFPKRAIPANLIADEVKKARQAYWERIKARAKKPK